MTTTTSTVSTVPNVDTPAPTVSTVPNVETPAHNAPAMVQASAIVFEAVTTARAPLRADVHALKEKGYSATEAKTRAIAAIGGNALAIAAATGKGQKAAIRTRNDQDNEKLLAGVRAIAKDTATQIDCLRAIILDQVAPFLPGLTYVCAIRADGVKMARRADWLRAIEYASEKASATTKAGKPAAGAKAAAGALQVLKQWAVTMEAMRSA